MGVLTESDIRKAVSKNKDMKSFLINKGQIITPSAKSYLSEKSIELKYIEEFKETDINQKSTEIIKEKKYKYKTVFGAMLDEKPEHMTQLEGNLLVFKDHKRILLRGKIDSLESKILESQVLCKKNDMLKLAKELQEILEFVRKIMRCEVLNEPIGDFCLLGLNPKELRDQSHYPKKYFGVDHEFINYEMGEIVVTLNSIRSTTREVELCAYETFKGEYGDIDRGDIILALNRLSSLFWIMIYKVRTGKYK